MGVAFTLSVLRHTRWYEYTLRFFFGGAVTVVAGILAKHYGPVFGGLFLAFPAIFPAGATLIEKHETEKKRRCGIADSARGRKAAALDARGAAMGSLGLICFALTVWKCLPLLNAALCLLMGVAVWLVLSVLIWRANKFRHGKTRGDPSR
jgi:succinate-acetate transporter protein